MKNLSTIGSIVLFAFSFIFSQTALINIPLTVTDNAGGSAQLYFGLDPAATDGIDVLLGEVELPPFPPTGIFDARFIGDDIGVLGLGQGSLKDYRQGTSSSSTNKLYELKYQAGTGTSITISWNLPAGVTGKINDLITGAVVDFPMNGNGSTTISNLNINKLKLNISYTSTSSINITSPNGGEVWGPGTSQNITWTSAGVNNVKIEYTIDNGTSWSLITSSTPANADTYQWIIPNSPSALCKVRISDVLGGTSGTSESNFIIGSAPSILTLSASNITKNSAQLNGQINPNGLSALYHFEYGTTTSYGDSTTTKNAGSGADSTSFNEVIGAISSNTIYHYRLAAWNSAGAAVGNDSTFKTMIDSSHILKILSPATGKIFLVGQTLDIKWTDTWNENLKIELLKDNSLYATINSSTSNTGEYLWPIPDNLISSDKYKIRITSLKDSSVSDTLGGNILIMRLNIDIPDGGESIRAGYPYNIKWHDSVNTNVKVELFKGGIYYLTIIDSYPCSGLLLWNIPSNLYTGEDYKIKISLLADSTLYTMSDSSFEILGIIDAVDFNIKPLTYNLFQNYPNPFNPSTTINYSVPKTSFVSIKVYDILGNEVAALVNAEKKAGNYSVQFAAGSKQLASGIYIYRMQAGDFTVTKKLILLK